MASKSCLQESHYRHILNFFYFLFLDETMALQASTSAAHKLQKQARKSAKANVSLDVELIRIVRYVARHFTKNTRRQPARKLLDAWTVPPVSAQNAWRELVRDADTEIVMTAIAHLLLGYDEATIGQAWSITEGTVLYRSGHALGMLGRRE